MTFEWVPGVAVGLSTGAISFWASTRTTLAVIDVRLGVLKDGDTLLAGELKAAVEELRRASSDIRALSVEQSVINKVQHEALRGIVTTLDEHSKTLASHSTAISMLSAQISSPPASWRPNGK